MAPLSLSLFFRYGALCLTPLTPPVRTGMTSPLSQFVSVGHEGGKRELSDGPEAPRWGEASLAPSFPPPNDPPP